MKGRKIVFVNQATGYLTIDIINAFVPHFDEVAVIYGDIRVQDIRLHPKVQQSKVVEKTRKSNLAKFAKWLIASVQIFFLLATRYRKYEIFYFSVPPFAYLSSLFLRRKFSLLMWDVYPDALKIANIGEVHILFRTWAALNKKLLKRAFRIYTIGDSLKELLAKYVGKERIEVIHLWTGLTGIKPISKQENPFIVEHNLHGKFIVQYSGNIGPTHNIETLLEVAKLVSTDAEIRFVIIGRGIKYVSAQIKVEEYGLKNFLFLPFQPDDWIKYSLAAADISVVLIDEKMGSVSIPSKVYNILAIGTPILSISPKGSEIDRLIGRYKNGENFTKDEVLEIAEFIKSMKTSPVTLKEFKGNSLLATKDFTVKNANQFLISYLN